MDTRRSLRKFYRFAYWSVGLVFVLVLVLFLIITDASIYVRARRFQPHLSSAEIAKNKFN